MNIARFNQIVGKIADPNKRDISKAMAVVLLAGQVGPFSKRLAEETGYPEAFVESTATHMQEAGLWINGLVDDTELWDPQEELIGHALFTHAKVALGQIKRQKTADGALYVDISTGRIVANLQSHGVRSRCRNPRKSVRGSKPSS